MGIAPWAWSTFGGFLALAGPAVATYAITEILGGDSGPWDGFWALIGVLLSVAGVVLAGWQQHSAQRRAKSTSLSLTAYNDQLSDLHRAVGKLLNSGVTGRDQKDFFRTAVGKASGLFTIEGTRVCVYSLDQMEVEQGEGSDVVEELGLVYIDSGGRSDEPREVFRPTDEYGREAIKTACGTAYRTYPSPGDTCSVDRSDGSMWKSFIQVPLRFAGVSYGLLSIDFRSDVRFTMEHVAIAWAASKVIVLGMIEIGRAADDTRPQVDDVLDSVIDAIANQSPTSESGMVNPTRERR